MTDKTEIIELYSVFAATITANEQRRQSLSAFYTSLIAAAGALLASDSNHDPVWIATAVFVVSMIWFLSMRYFRRLAKAKFEVIAEMESKFDFRPFELEWHHFKYKPTQKKTESGDPIVERRKWTRWTLTHFDQVIPFVVALSSASYLVYRAFVDPGAPPAG